MDPLPLNEVAARPLTSRSEALTPTTVSLKITWTDVRLLIATPARGLCVNTTGGLVLMGGELTVMLTGAEVASVPCAPKVTEVRIFVPKAALLQTML